ncbi:MAG: Fis family transcriptional regulator [Gammaproteobacteria bacterium (ex Lamellibrachia satsuma)]|nr:MAG: sigma-54-dependent Fis family transcriptional regulator [Gammaproteobacteria bacterium (ex Lamellibrachia satsuma)]RRS34578.1 MAG: Fis family transcriptional regulator [Gammaproteobacteria bacterium (ex Lamellibrachia satsuma)]RRS37431.1 MAG: Fis family transcriptional regulator [Gammaproteobacteria bacterium (ex Lamellibrachia satsuma)]
MSKILIVDDDVASCRTLQLHLQTQGYDVKVAHSVESGLAQADADTPELVILDIRMPGISGLEGLPEFKKRFPVTHVIMITAFHDMESTIEAMQKGADDYIHKPLDIDELEAAIEKLLAFRDGTEDLVPTEAPPKGSNPLTMVGRSRAMKEVFKTIGLVAKSPATVLITGESGTGKELVARAVHRSSENPEGPFVAINCAALVETLLESDMFGHEKGAFTGAVNRQEGKFALARGGTIFLDEVGELSPSMQAKLLRVLQYKEFTPLGAKMPQSTDARVIAATNLDLSEQVKRGNFREDLYYRLQVVNVHLPPLRDRKEDLMDLIQTLLGRINKELRRNVTHISKDVLQCLESYQWPGNVRELENLLMKCVALSPGDNITRDLLPDNIRCCGTAVTARDSKEKPMDEWSLEEMEMAHVARVLNATHWHKGRACEILGVSRPRLRRMINQFQLVSPAGEIDEDEEPTTISNA